MRLITLRIIAPGIWQWVIYPNQEAVITVEEGQLWPSRELALADARIIVESEPTLERWAGI